jgi:hypothetical protein
MTTKDCIKAIKAIGVVLSTGSLTMSEKKPLITKVIELTKTLN